jgi:hypothetical protein
MENDIKRGSVWRKWDLQIHTPFSYLNNQFGDNFDNYVKNVFKKALENNICAIGITDYFCIEGYKKIKNDYLNKQKLKELEFSDEEIKKILNILILPNIEFRLNTLVGTSRINFHVIFSNDVSIQDIEESFLHELDFVYEGNPQDEDEKQKLKIPNLKSLGKKLKEEHENFNIKIENLEFSTFNIISDFNSADFLNFLEDNINYHNSIPFKEEGIAKDKKKYEQANKLFKQPNDFKFNEEIFKNVLKQLLTGILANSLLLKTRKDEEAVLSELFKNRFKINYLKSITKDGTYFYDMSDGEKMIALLEFIFKFDDYNYPIMLDQPEDDLDVRAISKYIVDFLRKQKIKRQIFIVSHNANLVVCGDSEEIVVAEKKKKNYFEYNTGSIENNKIRKEIIEVLEGGEEAIRKRKNKLGIF